MFEWTLSLPIPVQIFFRPFAWIWRQLTMAKPVFLPPVQKNSKDGVVWWHLPVEIRRSWFLRAQIKNCQARLIRNWKWKGDQPPGEGIHLRWLTAEGDHKATRTMKSGFLYWLPIARRCEDDEHDAVITGATYFSKEDQFKWERSKRSEFHIELLVGRMRIKGPTYTLHVPERGDSNGHFWLELWLPKLKPD